VDRDDFSSLSVEGRQDLVGGHRISDDPKRAAGRAQQEQVHQHAGKAVRLCRLGTPADVDRLMPDLDLLSLAIEVLSGVDEAEDDRLVLADFLL
jgi:hypothetical protein